MTYTENQLMILAATFFAVFAIAAIGSHVWLCRISQKNRRNTF